MGGSNDSDDSVLSLFRGASIVFVGLLFERGLAFVVKLLLARTYGQTGYGAVSIGITIMATVSTISVLGLHTGVGRYLPRYSDSESRRGILVSAFSIVAPVSVLAATLCFAFAETLAVGVFRDQSLIPIIQAFSVIVPVNAIVILTLGVVQGRGESTPKVLIQNLSLPVSKFVVVGIGLLLGASAVGISWGYVGAYALILLVCLFYLFRRTSLFETIDSTPMYGELLWFSLPLLVSTAMGLILNSSDTFILGYVSTTADVGVYKVVYPLAKLLLMSLGAFGFILLPLISEYHSKGELETMRVVYRLASKWILIISLPVFFSYLFIPGSIIAISFGPEYVEGQVALAALSIGFICHAVAGPNTDTLISLGHTRLVMVDNVLTALINIVLNVVLIPRYGYLGAAVATTLSYAFLNVITTVQLYRRMNIHPVSRSVVQLVVGGAGIGFVCAQVSGTVTSSPLVSVGVFVSLFGPLYLIAIAVAGNVSENELMLLDSLQERTGIDLSTVRSVLQ